VYTARDSTITTATAYAPSGLPDYITITPHIGADPYIARREHAIADTTAGNLADEDGMHPLPNDEPQRYDAGGGEGGL
jgi:hypothetical protein